MRGKRRWDRQVFTLASITAIQFSIICWDFIPDFIWPKGKVFNLKKKKKKKLNATIPKRIKKRNS